MAGESESVMVTLRGVLTRSDLRGLAPVLVALLLLFCLSSAAPALAGEHGCQGSDSSARICGQSGVADPIPFVVQQTIPFNGDLQVTTPLPVLFLTPSVPRFHAGPSAPRAPPRSLA